MLTSWLVLRFIKWTGIAVFSAGLGLSVGATEQRTRLAGGLTLGTIGLLLTWMAGYGQMKATGLALGAPHISATLLTSLIALVGGALGGLTRGRVVPAFLVTLGVTASMGVMTAKADPTALWVLGAAVPTAIGLAAAALATRMPSPTVDSAVSRHALLRWFTWIARAEGLSLLVLFGVFLPLKYGAHIEIDGGQGWIGWVHGLLVFLYLLALGAGGLIARWGLLAMALGFVASLLPFGTFAFERWLAGRTEV